MKNESLNAAYGSLAAQLGDIEFKLALLQEQKSKLLKEIASINDTMGKLRSMEPKPSTEAKLS